MNAPKLHHFLPQVIQKQFSSDGKNIFRFDKQSLNWTKISIKGNAAITNFNTIYDNQGTKNTILESQVLSSIDGKFLNLLNHIKQRKSLDEMRGYIIDLLSFTYSRVPKQRNNWERIVKDLARQFKALGMEKHGNANTKQNEIILGSMAETDVYSRVMSNSYFWVGVASNQIKYFTSDNPCGSSYMPISPEFSIMSGREKRPLEYVTVPDDLVKMFNQQVYNDAERYSYNSEILDLTVYQKNLHAMPGRPI
jgi:hypothetical protein